MELETGCAVMLEEASPEIEEISRLETTVREIYQNFSNIVDERLNRMTAMNRVVMTMENPSFFRRATLCIKRTTSDIAKYKKLITSEYKVFVTLHSKLLSDSWRLKLSPENSEVPENLTGSLETLGNEQNRTLLAQQVKSSLRELKSAVASFLIFHENINNGMISFPFANQNQRPPILLTEIDTEYKNVVEIVTENDEGFRKVLTPKEKGRQTKNEEIPSKRPHLLVPDISITTESEQSTSEDQLNVASETSDASSTSQIQVKVESETSDASNTSQIQVKLESEISDASNTSQIQVKVESETSDASNTESQSNAESETLEHPENVNTTVMAECKIESNVETETSRIPIISLIDQDKTENKRENIIVIDLTD